MGKNTDAYTFFVFSGFCPPIKNASFCGRIIVNYSTKGDDSRDANKQSQFIDRCCNGHITDALLPEETVQEVKRSQAAPVFLQRMLKEAAIGFPNNL